MAGYDSPYVPGWDCHGLPIEHKVDQELGAKKAQMTAAQVRRVCRKYAEKWVNLQREDFKRLGILGRWDDPYLTMKPAVPGGYRARVRRFSRQGLRIQRAQAGQLVHSRPHRARRSRSRVREPQEPLGLGSFCA